MSRRQREGFLIFHDTLELLAELDAEDFKAVLLAVGNLSESVSKGEAPAEVKFKGLSKIAYGYLKEGVMYSNRKYQRSSAFNRAKRLGIIEPQKKTIKDLSAHGFSATDIAIFKDLDEEEVQEVLRNPEIADERTITENTKIKNLTDEIMSKGVLCMRHELEKQIGVWIDQGKEDRIRAVIQNNITGMKLADLMAYVNRK